MSGIVVIGGGFAGTAAACRLADAGHRPLLLERAPRLGGRATSTLVKDPDEVIDVGQHILMRCCRASTGFLARIGASAAIRFQPGLSIPIVSPTVTTALRSAPLPGILHLAPSLLRYRPLPLSERLSALWAGAAMALHKPKTDVPFVDWLAGHGQSERAIRLLWNPICIATLNASADAAGARAAHKVFSDALFRANGAGIGFFTAPLATVFDAAQRYIEHRGGVVRTSTAVRRFRVDGHSIRGVELHNGDSIRCRAVVCAVPPADVGVLDEEARALDALVDRAGRLSWSPIVDLHAWFDRSVLDEEFLVAVDSPIQAVFDVTRLCGSPSTGGTNHLVVSLSAADAWIDRPFDEVSDTLLNALGALFPAIRKAACVRTLVVRHRRATFVPGPEEDLLRPRATTPVRGLYLAGDWTSTGWPSTIEGAVRSGIVAAARLEEQLTRPN